MLPQNRRNKKKVTEVFLLSIGISLLGLGIFAFVVFQEPLLVSPLAKTKSADTELKILLASTSIPYVHILREKDLSYKIDLENGAEVFISPKKDLRSQLSSLQQIIKQLTIEGKDVKSIDFRFEKPVLVFK